MSIKLRTPYVITLLQANAPEPEVATIKLYAHDDGSGKVELFVRNADGTDSKITNEGEVTAGALLNAEGLVNISASSAPTVGRALIATSTTAATWQDVVTSTAPAAVDVNPAVLGDSLTAARGDHKHSVLTAAPVMLTIGSVQSIGSATTLSRSDHIHTTPGLATTAVSGYMLAADKAKLNGIATNADVTLTALSTAAVDIAVNNKRITGLGDPSNAQDACTKAYADAVTQGLDVKASCRAIATSNIVQSGTQTIDGVAVQVGNRVLCAGQTAGASNGIYVVAAGAWSRALDADSSADVTSGIFTFVVEGTSNADSGWVLITLDPIVLGTTPLVFTQFSGAGQIQAGDGLTKSGNTLNVVANIDGSIAVSADDVRVGVISDTQHGTRGGGTTHPVVTGGVNGFMLASDKVKLNGIADGADVTLTALANAGSEIRVGNSISAAGNIHADGGVDAGGHLDCGGSLYMNNPGGDLRYNPARTRTITISLASGYPEGQLSGNPPSLGSDGWMRLVANAAIVYALPVPATVVMRSVSVKAGGSSSMWLTLKKRTGINMGAGNSSTPSWGDIKNQNFGPASTTVVSLDFNPTYTAKPSEDYALRVTNVSGQPDLVIYAIQLTYDENYIRTDGSR